MKFLLMIMLTVSCSFLPEGKKVDERKIDEPRTAQELFKEDALESVLALKVNEFTLDNGLKVLLVQNGTLPIVSYYTFYSVGSKFENDTEKGVTHFLEHMMFKGSKSFPKGQYDQIIESYGGSTNAYTSKDMTVYYASVPSHLLNSLIPMEADRMTDLIIQAESLEKERMVVWEEKKMRYDNSSRGKLEQAMSSTMFKGTPYEEAVIGTDKTILGIKQEQMEAYYKTFYAPNNAVLVVVGNFNEEEAIKQIRDSYGKLQPNPELEKTKQKYLVEGFALNSKRPQEVHLRGNAQTPVFYLAYPGFADGEKDSYALDLLASILGEGQSSYLEKRYLHDNKPLLSNIFATTHSFKHAGLFLIGGTLLKGIGIRQIQTYLKRDLKKFCKEISEDERSLLRIKNQFWVSFYGNLQTNSEIAHLLGEVELGLGSWQNYKDMIAQYEQVSLSDLTRVCYHVISNENPSFFTIWNKNSNWVKK